MLPFRHNCLCWAVCAFSHCRTVSEDGKRKKCFHFPLSLLLSSHAFQYPVSELSNSEQKQHWVPWSCFSSWSKEFHAYCHWINCSAYPRGKDVVYSHPRVLTLSCTEWEALSHVQWPAEFSPRSCTSLEIYVSHQSWNSFLSRHPQENTSLRGVANIDFGKQVFWKSSLQHPLSGQIQFSLNPEVLQGYTRLPSNPSNLPDTFWKHERKLS